MVDEKGVDDKVICVPLDDPNWNAYEHKDPLPDQLQHKPSTRTPFCSSVL